MTETGRFAALYRRINELAEIVLSHTPTPSIHGLTNHTALGWTVTPRAVIEGGESDIEVKAFALKLEKADYLFCIPWLDTEVTPRTQASVADATHYTVSELVRVAKPWTLRRAPFDGLTLNGQLYEYFTDDDELFSRRHVTVGSYHEIQTIVEPYRTDELVFAVKGIKNGAHIVDPDEPDEPPGSIAWQDMNVNSHAWAQTFERMTEDADF